MYFPADLVASVLLLLLLITLKSTQAASKFKGGYLVPSINSTPYQVSLQLHGSHFCSGAFISSDWILTSARCTNQLDISTMGIRAGSLNRSAGGVVIKLNKIIQHSNYDMDTYDYDFALLQLQTWSNESIVYGYVKLPEKDADVEDGVILTVSGWGSVLFGNSIDDLLHAEEVIKVNQALCNVSYSDVGLVTNQMICSEHQEENKDSCQRDTGSPLVLNAVIVGVLSWGYGCSLSVCPDVYSRVSTARDWIANVTGL